jgi:hypothetical protein
LEQHFNEVFITQVQVDVQPNHPGSTHEEHKFGFLIIFKKITVGASNVVFLSKDELSILVIYTSGATPCRCSISRYCPKNQLYLFYTFMYRDHCNNNYELLIKKPTLAFGEVLVEEIGCQDLYKDHYIGLHDIGIFSSIVGFYKNLCARC